MNKMIFHYLTIVTTATLVMSTIHLITNEVEFIKNAKLKALYKIEQATQNEEKQVMSTSLFFLKNIIK